MSERYSDYQDMQEDPKNIKQYDRRFVFDKYGKPFKHIWIDDQSRPRKRNHNEKTTSYRRATYDSVFELYVVGKVEPHFD